MKIAVLFDPRDMWVGVFWTFREQPPRSPDNPDGPGGSLTVYVCLVPCFPIRMEF